MNSGYFLAANLIVKGPIAAGVARGARLWYHTGMKTKYIALLLASVFCGGCFTISETPFPEVVHTSVGADRNLAVQLSGFEATVTTYVPVYGWETVHSSTPCRRHRHHTHTYTTVATETYVPQVENTSAYIDRATDILKKCGFVLQSSKPRYRINVNFSGPFVSGSESASTLAWSLFSAFTADYGVQTWTARMKIYDLSTGKVCLFNDYTQKYESYVWGPIPIFSPAGSEKSNYGFMQDWCLAALTDRAMADATSFLASANVE